MASLNPGVIALFDVDGTLTAPRKVFHSSTDIDTPLVCSYFLVINLAMLQFYMVLNSYQIYCLLSSIVK